MSAGSAVTPTAQDEVTPTAQDEVTPTAQDELDNRTGWRVATVVAGALLLVAYAALAALPASPLTLSESETKVMRSLAPQGWAFFTKSPRSKAAIVYQHQENGDWRNITARPADRARAAMGLDRMGRAQGTEVALLAALLPSQAWQECDQNPTACLSDMPNPITVLNKSNHHSVCGEVGIVMQEVLPWGWRHTPTTMPSKVARMGVKC